MKNILNKFFVLPVFLLAGFFLFTNKASATKYISTDQAWTKSQSPIVISELTIISEGVKLTIEPGVIVKIGDGDLNEISSSGEIFAVGTQSEPIIFTSIKDDGRGGDSNGDGNASFPQPGDWLPLFLNSGSTTTLEHAIINYGGAENQGAIQLFRGKLAVKNCLFSLNQGGITNNGGKVGVYNSSIYNNLSNIDSSLKVDFGISNNGSTDLDVTAENNWWGSPYGPCAFRQSPQWGTWPIDWSKICPGQVWVDNGVDYDPWLTRPPEENAKEPVIIVPGIMGSYLNKGDSSNEEVWMNIDKMVLSYSDDYLDYLSMDENGNSLNNISVPDAIRRISKYGFVDESLLGDLIDSLTARGYKENENLFIFPYDWRQGIEKSSDLLDQKIKDVLAVTQAGKVNVIAHSMGGLVTKAYMSRQAGTNAIDKFIDIGTPHLGAAKAFKALTYGEDFDIWPLNQNRIKIITQNMPSVYELLPSVGYYDSLDLDYNYIFSDQGFNYDYNDLNSYLRIWNNRNLTDNAVAFHNTVDDYSQYVRDTKTYNIIGCGLATIGKINRLNKEKDKYEYQLAYLSGDGTVPQRSAEGIVAGNKYYIDGIEHMSLPSAGGVINLVDSILAGEELNFNLSQYNMGTHSDICGFRGTMFSFHSPISLDAYDENGNHVGLDSNGNIENKVPRAQYDTLDDNKFVFLPEGHTYRVAGKATDIRSFNVRVKKIDNGRVTQTAYFNNLLIESTDLNVEMTIADSQTEYGLRVDKEGDHTFETIVQPSSILNESESADLIKPATEIEFSGTEGNSRWYLSDAQVKLISKDNIDGSGVLKTEYSLDSGDIWNTYSEPFVVSSNGTNKIIYKSTDRAGNLEEEKTAAFKIDKIAPQMEVITPEAGDEFERAETLQILYNINDELSGIDEAAEIKIIDGIKISSDTIDLFGYHLGKHELIIKVADLAGNRVATSVPFEIITSYSGIMNDIVRLDSEKEFSGTKAKEELLKELDKLNQFSKKFGQRQIKRQKNYQNRIEKCQKLKKRADDCRKQVEKLFEKQKYILNKIYGKIAANGLDNLLKDLDKYFARGWLTLRAYEIIKEDIIYLKITQHYEKNY